jgi:hypothetical protein
MRCHFVAATQLVCQLCISIRTCDVARLFETTRDSLDMPVRIDEYDNAIDRRFIALESIDAEGVRGGCADISS